MNHLKILLKDSFWLVALGQGLRRFTLYKLLVMLIHWLIAHILKSKLGDYIITQNVLLISGGLYLPNPIDVKLSHVCCFGHEMDRSDEVSTHLDSSPTFLSSQFSSFIALPNPRSQRQVP